MNRYIIFPQTLNRLVRAICIALPVLLLANFASGQTRNQTTIVLPTPIQEYRINGIAAWSTAKTYNFRFYPTKQGTTNCGSDYFFREPTQRDGVDTNLSINFKHRGDRLFASVIGGNMIMYPSLECSSVAFRMFYGKRRSAPLATGWKVKEVRLNGSYRWLKKPEIGGRKIGFSIIVDWPQSYTGTSKSVTIKEIVLEGPPNQNWQDAFKVNLK